MGFEVGNKHAVGHGRPVKYEGEKTDNLVFEFASKYPVVDTQIADFLEISKSTLNEWKHNYPSFSDSLNRAKEIIDSRITSALFKRAEGYIKKETKVFCHEGCIITEDINVEVEPNPTAMIFWLKNRQSDKWKDRQEISENSESKIKIEIKEESL